jgi:hypothetical protein
MHDIRDRREQHWFWIDDAVIDPHATALGPFGLALYMVLARHADDNGDGEIRFAQVQEHFGASDQSTSVWRARPLLVRRGLITQHEHSNGVLRSTLRACPDAASAEDAAS